MPVNPGTDSPTRTARVDIVTGSKPKRAQFTDPDIFNLINPNIERIADPVFIGGKLGKCDYPAALFVNFEIDITHKCKPEISFEKPVQVLSRLSRGLPSVSKFVLITCV